MGLQGTIQVPHPFQTLQGQPHPQSIRSQHRGPSFDPVLQLAQIVQRHFFSPHLDFRNEETAILVDFLEEVSWLNPVLATV